MGTWGAAGLEAWDREARISRFRHQSLDAGELDLGHRRSDRSDASDKAQPAGQPLLMNLPLSRAAFASTGVPSSTPAWERAASPSSGNHQVFPGHVPPRLQAPLPASRRALRKGTPPGVAVRRSEALLEGPVVEGKATSFKASDDQTRILPEPLGGPPMSQKLHAADVRGREGLGDVDARRLENAVWRLWLKNEKGGLPPRGGAEGNRYVQKASRAIGKRFNFSPHATLIAEVESERRSILRDSSELYSLQRSLDAELGVSRVPHALNWLEVDECSKTGSVETREDAETSPSNEAKAAKCSLPEPLGGPAVRRRRHSMDHGLLNRGDIDVRRFENAAWRLWLKERMQPSCIVCSDREDETVCDFVKKAHDVIGWQIDFANLRHLQLKQVWLPTRDSNDVFRLAPGSPEFQDRLADVCRIFKTAAQTADTANPDADVYDEPCYGCLTGTERDSIVSSSFKAEATPKEFPTPCQNGANSIKGQGPCVRLMASAAAQAAAMEDVAPLRVAISVATLTGSGMLLAWSQRRASI